LASIAVLDPNNMQPASGSYEDTHLYYFGFVRVMYYAVPRPSGGKDLLQMYEGHA